MKNWIIVNSHSRSGTHFLIDTLVNNIKGAVFPNHKNLPRDFNIATLIREKNEKIYQTFKDILDNSQNKIIIVKNHLLPEELNLERPQDKYEEFLKQIFSDSKNVYIYRNGKDVLTSYYKYFNDLTLPFSKFIRQKNDYISPLRQEKDFDANRVKYWTYHIECWKKHPDTVIVKYEDLKTDFENTLKNILESLGENIPDKLHKPGVPKNILLHRIRLKLNKLGLIKNLKSSSVKPRKGITGDFKNFFSEEDIEFFNQQINHIYN